MTQPFSPEILRDIRRNISRSLTDTFQMMFQMDILMMQPPGPPSNNNVSAHIDMANDETSACLSVTVSRKVVEHICRQLQPGIPPQPHVVQDIVCEITNIVSNHLRSYMADKMGIEFALSLPKAGPAPANKVTENAISLHFRLQEQNCIELDFSYAA
ncbi:MAG: hypothetical protein P4M15_13235 [Alphaproteobacteria bacterium]|nr:hypothetical protein [Alphaproteobacteria bacterium]